jgi:PAS domain S-box-containing protein
MLQSRSQFPKSQALRRRKGAVQSLRGLPDKQTKELKKVAAEREHVTAALRESEVRFRLMADTAPVLIWMSDPDAQCMFFNKPWLEFTGRTLEQEQGNGWSEGLHPDDFQFFRDTYHSAFRSRESFRMEYRLRRADDTYRWVLNTGIPRFAPDGSFAGYIGSCIDISDRKQMEEMLNYRTLEVQAMVVELQQLARVATHDFQEPLRMVISYVQLLRQRYQGKLDPDAEQWIAYAVEGSRRLQRLILDLLAYHEVGTRTQEFTAVNCEAVLTGVFSDLRRSIADRGAVITHDPLPTVWGDLTQLQIVFRNLASNGIKFHHQEPPHVHISATQSKTAWVFTVRDNGSGIDPQYLDRLFLVFQRLHAREPYPKPGVGLAMCKKIIERHGGRIWCESELGKGTTFFFTIPY